MITHGPAKLIVSECAFGASMDVFLRRPSFRPGEGGWGAPNTWRCLVIPVAGMRRLWTKLHTHPGFPSYSLA